MAENEGNLSFWSQTKNLTWPFWAVNIMEMFERLAYYGVRVVIPIYIAQADEIGGLHFSQSDKGTIFMAWAFVQAGLPLFVGGFADRYGYKKQIAISILMKIAGYILMATQREFWPFFAGCMTLAAGTAVFKPPIQGTFVKTLTEKNSGVGWGFFYMVVNIGGFLGPPAAHFLYGYGWPTVFYGCAALVSVNMLWLFSYKTVESGMEKVGGVWRVIVTTAKNLMNPRLLLFILIISAFWAAFMQLFDMLPNFIVDWIDSSMIAKYLPKALLAADTSRGLQVSQEWVINLNCLVVVLFVAPLSWYVNKKMRRLSSIFFGIVITSFGIYIAGSSQLVYTCLAGIVFFSVGEMLCSPKMHEYLGVIAPHDKKALYMGYANIPFAIGWGYGSFAGGRIYENVGEKAGLALKYLSEQLHVVDLPSRSEAFKVFAQKMNMSAAAGTEFLWNTYEPYRVWKPFMLIGLSSALALFVFNHFAKKWENENV